MQKPDKILTVLHAYSFDIKTSEGKAAWRKFKAERKASGARQHGPVFHDAREDLAFDGCTVELETADLFDNQWNANCTGKRFRAFDWLIVTDCAPGVKGSAPAGIRRGYWLEINPKMQEIRKAWHACGYCGAKFHESAGHEFCPKCIGSEYLTPDLFKLTRLAPVERGNDPTARPELSETERAARLDLYREAQREGAKTRAGDKLSKFRAKVEAKAAKAMESAERERAGMIWLLDHDLGGLAADNCIFYNHTGRFCFGWRHKIDGALAHEIMGKLSDEGFPFPYDFETVNLGKLSGCVED